MAFFAEAQSPARDYASESAFHLVQNGHVDDAIAVYSKQIAAEPDNYILYLRRGLVLYNLHDYGSAIEDLTEAARLSPNKIKTAADLGDQRWNSGDPITHAWALELEIHVVRADALQHLNRFDEALTDLDTAVSMHPKHALNRHARGVVRMLIGRYDDAIEDFDTVLGQNEVVSDTLFARGLAYFCKEDWLNAKDDFARAAKIAPRNAKIAEWLKRLTDKTRALGISTT